MSTRTNITRINPTRNDMPAELRQKAITVLNQQLADTLDLYSQTKQAHWNVKGANFIAVHEFFDDLAESVEEFIDNIAERATALGGFALGTTRMAAATTRLAEYPDRTLRFGGVFRCGQSEPPHPDASRHPCRW